MVRLNDDRSSFTKKVKNSEFGFKLAIPSGCEPCAKPCRVSKEPYAILEQYADKARELEISILATRMPRELDVGDFAELGAEINGEKLIQRRDWDKSEGQQAELFFEFARRGKTWLRRSRYLKDGAEVYRIDAAAPKEKYEEVAEDCAICLMSFQPTLPSQSDCAEELLECSDSRLPLSFRYPASWQLEQINDHDELTAYELFHFHEGELCGRLRVEYHKRSAGEDAVQLIRRYADRLKQSGLHLNGAPIASKTPPLGFEGAHVYAPPATRDGEPVCVGIHCLERADAIVQVSFESPSRKVDQWSWAINKRTFEVIRESLSSSQK